MSRLDWLGLRYIVIWLLISELGLGNDSFRRRELASNALELIAKCSSEVELIELGTKSKDPEIRIRCCDIMLRSFTFDDLPWILWFDATLDLELFKECNRLYHGSDASKRYLLGLRRRGYSRYAILKEVNRTKQASEE